MRPLLGHTGGSRRRVVGWAVVAVVAVGAGIALWSANGSSSTPAATPLATATRGDVTATVGGVGRITEPGASAPITVAAGAAGGAATPAPANAVFARSSGHVGRLLVTPDQRVGAGQLIAEIDDGGAAATALAQAENDYASALLETRADAGTAQADARRAAADLETLRGGPPAARARALRIARRNVDLARVRLRTALAPAPAADAGSARAEVARAEADLAALRSAPAPSPEALAAAQQGVAVAQQRIAALRAPAGATAVSAAEADVRTAEADLASVQARTPPATQAELDAATQVLASARAALAKLTAPPDPVELGSAQLDLDKARADLAALTAAPTAAPEALAAAERTVDAARLKLRSVLAGAVAADRASARLEVQRTESELRALENGPSTAARQAAGAAMDAAAGRLALAGSQPRVRAALTQLATARRAAGALEVRTLWPGTVTALLTALGAPVDPSTAIATVADLDHLVASVDLSEFDVAQVHRGLAAIVGVDALGGRRVPGRVRFVALTGSDTGGVVSFPVQVAIARTKGLRAGLNVSVRIILARRRGVVRVPLEAVSSGPGDTSVVTVVDGSDRRSTRPVTLGLEDSKNVEVLTGLQEGERVALPSNGGGGP